MNALIQHLRECLEGDVVGDAAGLRRYAHDQSLYEIHPLAVIIPASAADVVRLMSAARDAGVSVTCRGGGSGTAGAALGRGLVLAFPPGGPMGRRVAVGRDAAGTVQAVCEPGVLHDVLQRELGRHGRYLPADPSSGGISVIGGNVATKASGPHALKHGSMDRYVCAVEAVLADGTVLDTARAASIPPWLVNGVNALRRDMLAAGERTARLKRYDGRKTASGYNLFPLVRDPWCGPGAAIAQLLVGSVGTLATVTRVTLRSEPRPEGRVACLVFFRDLRQACAAVAEIRNIGVAAIEIMNARTVGIVRDRHPQRAFPGSRDHLLLIECTGAERLEEAARVVELVRAGGFDLPHLPVVVEETAAIERLWALRKALLPTIRGYHPTLKPLSVVNDVGVPVESLAAFIEGVEEIFDRLGLPAALYGHAGSGNLHLRPLFDITDPGLPALIQQTADRIYSLVQEFDGTITAEHGMGPLRAPYLEAEWGSEIYGWMTRVKRLFDPENLLNPGAMFAERPLVDALRPLDF